MRLTPTLIDGVVVVESESAADDRGSFVRTWCRDTFAAAGLDFEPIQESLSRNLKTATLRGMHIQGAPFGEQKLVRCLRGRIFDVAVDLRPDSASYCRWFGLELDESRDAALFLPRGVAHGFITLSDDAWVHYMIDTAYAPGHAGGVRWDDPAFGIAWPTEPVVISDRDRNWPDHV
ncbi:putative dTDP-4-dehydrorhamnose 3,5-epimerase [Asticcacaulis biprosthecium C19]|uniref:dTDP-4-dehydrorhamnose 3,5-epimerase n=1 Tax=Asticcacaulis biprosthecium C19 TaxID=715226 RepID=F4QRR0_9CAUL|nr:dTDP-4-dehydrorhamnose 3,5-epimerase [Asticcacaulis biprosthecium]EGF89430.1 putative dTDP-4-dehydrorhamnose 3,5-epimerase [Asticcacaulis biprosthecium C19]